MHRSLQQITLVSLALFVVTSSVGFSAKPEEDPGNSGKPRIKVLLSSSQEFLDDAEYLVVDLAKEKKQWVNNLKDSIEIFLLGVDYNKPIRWDVLVNNGGQDGESGYRFQPCIPLDRDGKGLKTFIRENLNPIGIDERLKKRYYYQLTGDVFKGWMRIVDDKKKDYACIAAEGFEDDVPKEMLHPSVTHKELIKKGYDIALDLENIPEQTELRKTQADDLLAYFMEEIERKPDETKVQFEFRKLSQQQKYEQMHRVYVEAEHLTIGWRTNEPKKRGEAEFLLQALPETDLLKYLETMGAEPSRFAALGMAEDEDPVLGLRTNFPFDDFRRKQLNEWYPIAREAAKSGIDSSDRFQDSEKEPAKQATDLFFDMLVAGDPLGRLDLFADITVAETGKHVFVGGVLAANGKAADGIVKLMPQLREGWKVEMDAEVVGEIAIHKIDVSANVPQAISDFFGPSGLVYVGTSADCVWIAGGDGSLEKLKSAIDKVEAGKKTEVTSVSFDEASDGSAADEDAADEDAADEDAVDADAVDEADEDDKAGKADMDDRDNKFVDLKLHAGPLVTFSDELTEETGWSLMSSISIKPPGGASGVSGEGGASLQPIDPAEMRQIIRRSLADIDDRVTGVIHRTDDHISGRMTFAPGILRSLGKIVAKIAEDNL